MNPHLSRLYAGHKRIEIQYLCEENDRSIRKLPSKTDIYI